MSHPNIDFLEKSCSDGPDQPRWLSEDRPAREQITLPPRGYHRLIVLGANLIFFPDTIVFFFSLGAKL